MDRPRVVICGAGFAGLTLARSLKRAPVSVTLVDRNNYHLFTPLVYQVASSLLDPSEVAEPVRALVRGLRNCTFLQASVTGFDLAASTVLTSRGPLAYDYLVVATGSTTNYFGLDSMEARAHGLKELPEALALRNHVLEQFEASRWEASAAARRRLLGFAVVGGGPTGVEFAGALSELIHLVLVKDYPDLDLAEVSVVLLEAADRLLAPFDARLRAAAERSLRAKQVDVRLSEGVTGVSEAGISLADGSVLAVGTVVWTAGVRASDVGSLLGVPLARQGRVPVGSSMQLAGHPEVFVIGDLAAVSAGDEVLPMLIPPAMQQARHVARVIASLVSGSTPPSFSYHDPGIMATIGRNAGVAQLGPVKLSGFLGWLMWLAVHLINVVTLRNKLVVLINWAWEYLLVDRPVRLIVRAREPGRHK